LNLISFPQTTIARNIFLHSVSEHNANVDCLIRTSHISREHQFAVPSLQCVRNPMKGSQIEGILKSNGFVDDGVWMTEGQVLDCIDQGHDFDFPKYGTGRVRPIPSQQYVHRSGAVFMRCIRDRQGWAILAAIENYRHANQENGFRDTAKAIAVEVAAQIRKL